MLDKLKPTTAELLYVWRKREELNQKDMAAKFGVSRVRWGKWERGEETPSVEVPLGVEDLHEYEKCALARRRTGATQGDVASAVGVSRWWLIQMEAGKAPGEKLTSYWRAQA